MAPKVHDEGLKRKRRLKNIRKKKSPCSVTASGMRGFAVGFIATLAQVLNHILGKTLCEVHLEKKKK